MKLTTKTRYGTRLMVMLALNYKKGFIPIKDVVESEMVSKKYLEKIINLLKSHRLIKTARGRNGGYRLTLPPDKIRVADIFKALNEPVELVKCLRDKKCVLARTCVTRDLWFELSKMIDKKLSSMTLKQLATKKKIKERQYE